MKRIFLYCKTGFSTLEMLIAMTLIILIISSVLPLVLGNQSISISSQTNQAALYKAQKLLEESRAAALINFNSVVSTDFSKDEIYFKNIIVNSETDNLAKRITSQIYWNSNNSYVKLSTAVTDIWRTLGICNPKLVDANDWKEPVVYFFSTVDLVNQAIGDNLKGLEISDIKFFRGKMYISVSQTVNQDGYTLYIFDLPENPNQMPKFIARAQTVGGNLAGLNSIAVASYGDKIYVYSATTVPTSKKTCGTGVLCPQFQVIDVTPDLNGKIKPVVVSSADLKMPVIWKNNDQGNGKSIYYDKGYVYLGLIKPDAGPEFNIIDVGGSTGSPTNPILMGSYTVGRTINAIYVKNNYAYLSTTDNVLNNKQLIILDIKDKTLNPLPVAGYFNVSGLGVGSSILVQNDKIYFGRTYSSNGPEFYILNFSNLPFVSEFLPNPPGSHINVGTASNPDSVNNFVVRGDLVFLITNKQFQIWNISDFSNIYPWTVNGKISEFISLSSMGVNNGGKTLNCVGDYIYIGAKFKDINNESKDIIIIIGPKSSFSDK